MTTEAAASTPAGVVDHDQLTRAQKALLALTGDVARQLAEDHGVCVRPLAMRRIDLTTGRVDVVPVPCGARRDDVCRPCAEKARRLRMVQCREGWHLDTEPIPTRPTPTEEQKELLAVRSDLHAAYLNAREAGDGQACEEIADTVEELDTEIRAAGITAGSRRWIRQTGRWSSGRHGGGRTRRTCPAARSRSAPSARSTATSTDPRRSSRSPSTPTAA